MRVLLFLGLLMALPVQAQWSFTLPNFGSLPGFNLPGLGGSAGATSNGVHVPDSLKNNTDLKAAVVVLHGCLQGGSDILKASRLDEVANKEGFYVIVPEQSYSANPVRCWNWFEQSNQKRDTNEVAAILNVIKKALSEYPIDPERVVIAGFSAGAAMANTLAYCHADMFSGAVSMAGVKYAGARSSLDAFNVMRSGSSMSAESSAKLGHQCLLEGATYPSHFIKYMVVAGTSDNIVSAVNANQLVESNLKFYDLLDDSTINDSVLISGVKSQVAGKGSKRAYTQIDFEMGNAPLMRMITVDGMSHAWSGGTPNMQYSDAAGPDVTEMMVDFFNLR